MRELDGVSVLGQLMSGTMLLLLVLFRTCRTRSHVHRTAVHFWLSIICELLALQGLDSTMHSASRPPISPLWKENSPPPRLLFLGFVYLEAAYRQGSSVG